MGRAPLVSIFVISLAPSAFLAWQGRDFPHLGSFHDDAIYMGTAKSLAIKNQYRIDSLPWTPAQTKYPPLYPFYLSIAWRLTTSMEQVLPIAMFLNWLWLPVWALGVYRFLRVNACGQKLALALSCLLALHPEVQLAATRLMSDLMFAALVIWALALLSEERSVVMIGLAYLTRSAALPLYAGVAVIQLWRRQWRQLGILIAGAALPVGGWAVWVAAHRYSAQSAVEKYYTDYLAYQWHVVPLSQIPTHMVQQLDPLVAAISRSLLLNFGDSMGWLILSRIVCAACVVGIIRLLRRGQVAAYAAYALFSLLMMLVWYFPPDTRALLPLLPLLVLGLYVEVAHFVELLGRAASKGGPDRVLAFGLGPLCALLPFGMVLNGYANLTANGQAMFATERRSQQGAMEAHRWIAANTSTETQFFSVDDPLLHLYTHRKALRLPELGSVVQRSSSGEYRPTAETLAAMDRFNLSCLFISTKHFDPDPRFPDAPLRFSIEGTGLEERYRSRTELVACRRAKELPEFSR